MNPYYGTPGIFSLVEAFKDLVKMQNRWGGKWILWYDTRDKDYFAMGSTRNMPMRFIKIAWSYGLPAVVKLYPKEEQQQRSARPAPAGGEGGGA